MEAKKRIVLARISFVETVYHQNPGEPTLSVESRGSRELLTQEQVYSRKIQVTETGSELDLGWLKDNTGTLVIQNNEILPKLFLEQSTEPAQLPPGLKTLELFSTHDGLAWFIYPGDVFRGSPSSTSKLWLRSAPGTGTINCTIHVFPK